MPDRITEARNDIASAIIMSDRQQSDFKIEVDKTLNDDFTFTSTSTFLSVNPGGFNLIF